MWPAGTYENVKVVWTGKGSYATAGGCKNVLPAGVTLTTDKSVWDNAKSAWLAGSSTSRHLQRPGVEHGAAVHVHDPRDGQPGEHDRHGVRPDRGDGQGQGSPGERHARHRRRRATVGGARLTLQRRTGTSGWVKVTSKRTSDTGAVRTTVTPRRTTYYRWSYKGSAAHPAAHSRSVRVTR